MSIPCSFPWNRCCPSLLFVLVLTAFLEGCVRAPDLVLLDRKTVLEEQASGELLPLEDTLREAAIVPRGEGFTRGQLEEAGADLSHDALGRLLQIYQTPMTEPEYLDNLLVQRCIGEARNGLLVETPNTCTGRSDASRTSAAVQRANRSRKQLWRYLQERQPEATEAQIRHLWRQRHLASVICGGQIQKEDGSWERKQC